MDKEGLPSSLALKEDSLVDRFSKLLILLWTLLPLGTLGERGERGTGMLKPESSESELWGLMGGTRSGSCSLNLSGFDSSVGVVMATAVADSSWLCLISPFL